MKLKQGVTLAGLDIVMRPVLIAAEAIWKDHGIADGVTITEALGGAHSAASLHYYGRALDMRTRYFPSDEVDDIAAELRKRLGNQFDVIQHSTHIHVEFDPG